MTRNFNFYRQNISNQYVKWKYVIAIGENVAENKTRGWICSSRCLNNSCLGETMTFWLHNFTISISINFEKLWFSKLFHFLKWFSSITITLLLLNLIDEHSKRGKRNLKKNIIEYKMKLSQRNEGQKRDGWRKYTQTHLDVIDLVERIWNDSRKYWCLAYNPYFMD